MSKYRFLISGCGDAGLCVAEAAAHDGRGQIAGAFDPREKAIKTTLEAYPGAVPGNDYQQLVKQTKPDVVVIAGPDHLHAEQIIFALENGCHVLVEKPLTTSVADAERVVELAEKTGLTVMGDFTMRYVYPCREIALAARAGVAGRIFYVQGDYIGDLWPWYHPDGNRYTPWRTDKKNPQDIFMGGGCHPIDLMLWAVQAPVEEVYAYANKFCIPEFPADDCYVAIMKFDNGVLGKCFVSSGCAARGMGDTLEVYGDKATLSEGRILRRGAEPEKMENTCGGNVAGGHGWIGSVKDFLDTLDGVIENPVTARDSANTTSVCDAAIKSVHSGKPEKVVWF